MYDLHGFPQRPVAPMSVSISQQTFDCSARRYYVLLYAVPTPVACAHPYVGGTVFIVGCRTTLGGVLCIDGGTLGHIFL
jgi:hypothetical protein